MRIQILDRAERDLIEGFHFYESQGVGLGSYFLTNLYADIESLHVYAGIHRRPYKTYYRLLSRRFPFAIFYKIGENAAVIHAVLDCRERLRSIRELTEN